MRLRRFGLAAALGAASAAAFGQTVYVATDAGQFGALNVATGAYTFINHPAHEIGGLGYSGGKLYALGFDDNLYTVDGSGNETLVGACGMSFAGGFGMGGENDGTLYGTGGGLLYALSTSTGAATVVGPTGLFSGACASGDNAGHLYYNTNSPQELFQLNRSTGSPTPIGLMGAPSTIDALFFTTGSLYACDFSGNVWQVNSATAALTSVSTYNNGKAGNIFAAASVFAPVPEPASFAILGLGSVLVLRRRRRSW